LKYPSLEGKMFPEHTWNIHIFGSAPLNRVRQAIEDEITDRVDGIGKANGGGSGDIGWNISIEVFDGGRAEYCDDNEFDILLEIGTIPRTPIHIIRTEHRRLVRE
jgi:hypothetical protein